MNDLLKMLDGLLSYFVICFMSAASVMVISKTWRKNLGYPLAAIVFGTLTSYGFTQVEHLKPWSTLAGPLITVVAPGFILWAQRKSPEDLLKALRDVKVTFQKKED